MREVRCMKQIRIIRMPRERGKGVPHLQGDVAMAGVGR